MAPAENALRVGLIVNPLAGAGGPLAMHGSDALSGVDVHSRWSSDRAALALQVLDESQPAVQWFTGPAGMGAGLLGGRAEVLSLRATGRAEDTRQLARGLADIDVDLLLFAGGDGTARDVLSAVGSRLPVLG
jgi:predicted polyphosphate/ATP-dependent NAD kinase